RRLQENASRKMLPRHPAVLKRHLVGLGELQVGDSARRFYSHLPALGVARLIKAGEMEEGLPPLLDDFGRRAVGTEETVVIEFVKRQQPRNHLGHFGMTGQR